MSTEINISTGNLTGRFNWFDGSRKMDRLVQNLNISDLCLNLLSRLKKEQYQYQCMLNCTTFFIKQLKISFCRSWKQRMFGIAV